MCADMNDYTVKSDLQFVNDHDMGKVAERLLMLLGFQSRLIGTNYLSQAITLKYFDEKMSCMNIYSQIAQRHLAAPASVERAIRHSLNNCRSEGNIQNFNTIVGFKVIDRNFDTTSSEFISVVSRWLRWVRADNNIDKGANQ